MANERISRALQENLLTLVVHNNDYGKLIVQKVKTELFEGDYKTIADEAFSYWKDYKEAPGDQMDVELAHILEDRENKKAKTYRNILVQMIELKDSINIEYTMNSIYDFVEIQEIKAALQTSYEKMNANEELGAPEVRKIWADLLKVRVDNFNPGMRMMEISRLTEFLENQTTEFVTGISVFDRAHVVPVRKKLMTFTAPSGHGKTWFLVNIAKKALMLRKRVLFISLEMDEEEIVQRMYQSMFAAAKRSELLDQTTEFKLDSLKRLEEFALIDEEAEFTFDSTTLREELESRVILSERHMENLIVKRFAPRSIDVEGIDAFIDNLEWTEGFIPDMLVVDYMGRIKTDIKLHRLALGAQFEDYRGVLIKRNMAGVTAQQVSKIGTEAEEVQKTHVAEDISILNTSDFFITQSRNKLEKKYGLARLTAAKVRGERDEIRTLISQNYGIGQYCLQSIPFDKRMAKMMKEFDNEVEGIDPSDDEDGDEVSYDRDDDPEEE